MTVITAKDLGATLKLAHKGPGMVARQNSALLKIPTKNRIQIVDITDAVNDALTAFETQSGIVVVQTMHTTSGILVNEAEKYLMGDIECYLERLAPQGSGYKHDETHMRLDCPPDEPKNADAHLKALLIPTSQSLLYNDGRVNIGKWQRIMFTEFDGPCPRPNKSGARNVYIRAIGF